MAQLIRAYRDLRSLCKDFFYWGTAAKGGTEDGIVGVIVEMLTHSATNRLSAGSGMRGHFDPYHSYLKPKRADWPP